MPLFVEEMTKAVLEAESQRAAEYVATAIPPTSVVAEFADSNGCSGGRYFLKRFNANPERYWCEAREHCSR
jgi:hypothetical protein